MAELQKLNRSQIRNARAGAIILPYIILWVYILIYFIILFFNFPANRFTTILELLFYVSPFVCIINYTHSVLWRLCRWHKAGCILPILPFLTVFWHLYITPFESVYINQIIHIIIFILAIISSYKVYKQNIKRNATTS